jgi:hypothetical protein
MKTLAVWSSPTADGVDIALDRLRALPVERSLTHPFRMTRRVRAAGIVAA